MEDFGVARIGVLEVLDLSTEVTSLVFARDSSVEEDLFYRLLPNNADVSARPV